MTEATLLATAPSLREVAANRHLFFACVVYSVARAAGALVVSSEYSIVSCSFVAADGPCDVRVLCVSA